MIRYVACTAVVLFAAAALRAGELDSEFGARPAASPGKDHAVKGGGGAVAVPAPARASELDEEMPAQSWRRCGWGGCGWRGCCWGGCAWRGCGWRGCRYVSFPCYSYYAPCFSCYSPCFSVGYSGYPGWGGPW
jgi:hypothetical protein